MQRERNYQQHVKVGVRDFLRELESYKFMGPGGLHTRVLGEQGCETNTLTIFKKCEDNSKNYGPVSLSLVTGKIVEQLVLEAIFACMKKKKVT